jgi:ribosomal protein S18 acetylase RimI-like enzyme
VQRQQPVADATGLETLSEALVFAPARTIDLPLMSGLIFDHGPNVWNWLPAEGVRAHLQDIGDGHAHAVLAWQGHALVGLASYCLTHRFCRYQTHQRADAEHGYVCEVVVAPHCAGRGLGSELLQKVNAALAVMGIREVYIDRHEENRASQGMMRKAGFEVIDTFAEPARRPYGSGRTTVCRIKLD